MAFLPLASHLSLHQHLLLQPDSKFSQVDKFQEQMGSVRYLELDTVLGEGPKAGGALAEAAGQPHSLGDTPTPALLSPTPWASREQGWGSLHSAPPELPSFPSTYKAEHPEGQALRHRSNSSCTQESPGDLVPLV